MHRVSAQTLCQVKAETLWFKHRLPAIAALPDRVVFIDETAVKTNLTRLRGRAKRGERLTMDAPFGSWGTQTLIAGLTQDALIAPWLIKGAMDGPAFATYIREVLVPEIALGTGVILDNLATHRNKEATQTLRDHGCWFLYLPPYSPDLPPIEQAFSKLKGTFDGSEPEPSLRSSRQSQQSAISTTQ
ncbi:IS630 family transposase [Celeribacter sp. ULVN23_4]